MPPRGLVAPFITPNRLNKPVQFQRQGSIRDGFGQSVPSGWTTYYSCRAEIDAQNSSLIYETSQFVSKPTMRITVLWTKSVIVQPNDRILFTESSTGVVHTYEIQSMVNTRQANRELVVLAYEINAKE